MADPASLEAILAVEDDDIEASPDMTLEDILRDKGHGDIAAILAAPSDPTLSTSALLTNLRTTSAFTPASPASSTSASASATASTTTTTSTTSAPARTRGAAARAVRGPRPAPMAVASVLIESPDAQAVPTSSTTTTSTTEPTTTSGSSSGSTPPRAKGPTAHILSESIMRPESPLEEKVRRILEEGEQEEAALSQAGAFLDPAKAPAILRSINYKTILAFTKKSTEFVRELCTQKQRGAGARGNQDRVLLPKPMTRISQALTSEKLRREAGLPTVHAVSKAIVIGTSHGLVLVFDHQEHLRAILGNNEHIEYGAVTAIDVTPDGLWVATGHQNGYVIVWDVAQATEIKVLTELHKGSPVVHVRFVRNVAASTAAGKSSPNHSHVLSIDLVGVVYRTTLTSLLLYYSVASVKLLDGGSGQILAVAVLQAGNVPHATDSMGLVAMCSSTATFVIATSPDTALVFKLKHPDTVAENKMALPYLTWRSAYGSTVSALPGEHSKPRVRDPVLAIAYGRHVSLFQAVPSSVRDRRGVEFIRSSQYTTDITLAGVHWLGTQVLVLLNIKDQLRVLDPFALTELENLDVTGMQLVYHTRFSDPTLTAQQQSKCSFHNSVRAWSGQVYLLGIRQYYCASILSWSERIDLLTREGRWLEAMSLCLSFHEGNANAVVGLPKDGTRVRQLTALKMEDLLVQFISVFLERANRKLGANTATALPSNSAAGRELRKLQVLTSICIGHAIVVSETYGGGSGADSAASSFAPSSDSFANRGRLFESMYQLFRQHERAAVFLELLEPFILNDKLTHLNPAVMQAFVTHYRENNWLDRVEQCITHLDILSLDFHQVVTLCRAHHLGTALIYIYNRGLLDYSTPLLELMGMLESNAADQSVVAKLKHDILAYTSFTLAGRNFPEGTPIPKGRVLETKTQILQCLFEALEPSSAERTAAATNTMASADDGTPVRESLAPSFRITKLLRLDTAETLDAIGNAFNDTRFSIHHASSLSHHVVTHARMVDVLTAVLVDTAQPTFAAPGLNAAWPFTPNDQVAYFCFLAKFIALGTISLPTGSNLLQRIFSCLTWVTNVSAHEKAERERLLLDLVRALPSNDYDEQRVLLLAEGSGFYKVVEFFFLQRKNYDKAMECYLKDPDRSQHVFTFIRTLMEDGDLTDKEKEQLKTATLIHLTELVRIDPDATSNLILESFTDQHEQVLAQLEQHPRLQYEYIKGILTGARTRHRLERMGDLSKERGLEIANEQLHEKYIALMCEFAPKDVYPYLLQHSSYRLDYCLDLCQSRQITDATAYLLERTGDVAGALDLILAQLDKRIAELKRQLLANVAAGLSSDKNPEIAKMEAGITESIHIAVSVCQRHTERSRAGTEKDSEQLWFKLLDALVVPLRKLRAKQNRRAVATPLGGDDLKAMAEGRAPLALPNVKVPPEILEIQDKLTSFLREILRTMMGCVSITSILQKIVRDHGADEFKDFKGIIITMLDTYTYERNILLTAAHLLESDVHRANKEHVKQLRRAFASRDAQCHLCKKPLGSRARVNERENSRVLMYQCGHTYHQVCLNIEQNASPLCPICNKVEDKFKRGVAEQGTTPQAAGVQARDAERRKKLDRLEQFAIKERYSERPRSVVVSGEARRSGSQLTLAPPTAQAHIIPRRFPGSMPKQPLVSGRLSQADVALLLASR